MWSLSGFYIIGYGIGKNIEKIAAFFLKILNEEIPILRGALIVL